VAGGQRPAAGRLPEAQSVRRDPDAARGVGRVAGDAALLAVAGGARPDVALGLQRVAAGGGGALQGAGLVARPPRRVEALELRPGAERVLRLATGQAALGIGGDARALVAPEAEGLVAVARPAVRHVPARIVAMQGNVVGGVNVERADHTSVAI